MKHFELIRNRWENGYGFIIFILCKMDSSCALFKVEAYNIQAKNEEEQHGRIGKNNKPGYWCLSRVIIICYNRFVDYHFIHLIAMQFYVSFSKAYQY